MGEAFPDRKSNFRSDVISVEQKVSITLRLVNILFFFVVLISFSDLKTEEIRAAEGRVGGGGRSNSSHILMPMREKKGIEMGVFSRNKRVPQPAGNVLNTFYDESCLLGCTWVHANMLFFIILVLL